MDQPSKVASPARGQLNKENEHFPSRVSLLILHTQAEYGAYSWD